MKDGLGISGGRLSGQFKQLLKKLPADIDVIEKHLPITRAFDENVVGIVSGGVKVKVLNQVTFPKFDYDDNGKQISVPANKKYLAVQIESLEANDDLNIRSDISRPELFQELQSEDDSTLKNLYLVFSNEELESLYADQTIEKVDGTRELVLSAAQEFTLSNRKYLMREPKIEIVKTPMQDLKQHVQNISETMRNMSDDDKDLMDGLTAFESVKNIATDLWNMAKNVFSDELDYVRNHLNLLAQNSSSLNQVISVKTCSRFMKLSGDYSLAEWGTHIASSIIAKANAPLDSFLTAGKVTDLPSKPICPAYASMPKEEQAKVWVWVFLSMANAESSCRTDVTVQGVNDRAVGLLQIPQSEDFRRGSGGETCAQVNPRDPIGNLTCGMYMLGNQLTRYNKLFLSKEDRANHMKSYWQVLMAHQQRVIDAIQFYQPCQ